jgi:hypothetical protein
MNNKELVLAVAKQTQLPVDQVEKVSLALLRKFAEVIETQGSFQSPLLQLIGAESPAKPASEARPARPARKFARLRIPAKKPKG